MFLLILERGTAFTAEYHNFIIHAVDCDTSDDHKSLACQA